MSIESLKNSVRQYLLLQHMHVDDEWLTGCVEYLTEDSDQNLTDTELKNLAKEQWLLNDLKDICPGSLPANLKTLQKTTLTGRFVLQINAAVDIGTPAYQQYLKLQKVNMENVDATTTFEDKIPSHRMIKLYLTDGVQEISAIEYKPMRNLSCDITPGCKVLMKGPLECRRGILLLSETSIELLGGEVQEIAISNSLPGLLSSKLGITITQEPNLNTTTAQTRNTNLPTPHTQMPSAIDQSAEPTLAANDIRSTLLNQVPRDTSQPTLDHTRPIARVTCIQASNFADDDIDVDQLDEIEAQFTEHPLKRSLTETASNPEKKQKMTNQASDYPDDNELFFDDEDEDYLKEIEAKIDAVHSKPKVDEYRGPIRVPAEPFVYIKQINDSSESDKVGKVFKVKAQIMKLLSKLSVGKDGWSLKCLIVDGTGSLEVDFTSDVLSKLVGYTPLEMNSLKKQMASKPELQQKAVSALQKAKDTLQVLYCIIELTILDVPKITNLVPYDSTHVDMLKKRLRDSRL